MGFVDDITKLQRCIRERRRLTFTVFLSVLGLGVLVSYLLPNRYSSSMRILIRATPTDLRATPERADGVTIGQVSEEEVNSEVELLTNYDLLRNAVVENHLVSGASDLGEMQRKVDVATRKMGIDLKVEAVRKANIIEVQYAANSPERAASVLRTIEAEYLQAHLRAQSMPGGHQFFQNQMTYYKNQFINNQRAFAEFSDRQHAANLDQQLTLRTKTISDQETALQQAQAEASELHTEIAKSSTVISSLASRLDTTQKGVPNPLLTDHLATLLAEAETRHIQQLSKFRDDDPLVKETEQEIALLKAELQNAHTLVAYEVSTDVNPISQSVQAGVASRTVQLAGLESKINVLRTQIATNRSLVDHLTDVSGQYRLLSSDVQNAQDDYTNYVQRQENARVAETLDQSKISNVVVAQEPTESVVPISSHRTVVLIFSFFVALFASVTACVLAESYKPSNVLQPL